MVNGGAYVWDRANRLLSMGGASYVYDGEGRRVKQTIGAQVTQYLLDLQPGLAVVLSATQGANIERYIHGPTGIFARKDAGGAWHSTEQDALGTVRGEVDAFGGVEGTRTLDPFGNLIGSVNGTMGTPYGFTGEIVDGGGLLDLRARRYAPWLGMFASLDPLELANRYAYVGGHVVNRTDPSGMIYVPSGLELAHLINTSACYSFMYYQQQSTCSLNDRIDTIASYGRQEANQEDDQLLPTAAAIALAEINYLVLGNSPRARSATYSASTKYINADNSKKIREFVVRAVEGSCKGSLADAVNQHTSLISELAGYAVDLEFIAQNPTIVYEQAFISDKRNGNTPSDDPSGVRLGERLGSNIVTNVNNQKEVFMFRVFRGSTRSVIVSNDFNPVPLEWNCAAAENRVINASYDPNSVTNPDFVGNSSCVPSCRRNLWWWKPPTTTDTAKQYAKDIYAQFNSQYKEGNSWILVPDNDGTEHDYQSVRLTIGGIGHVASCS